MRITLLSVGAGQCAIVRYPPNHVLLIDAGSSTVPDVADRLLFPFLRDQGCTRIDRIILSHGDFDHISAAGQAFERWGRPQVLLSPHFARHAVGNIPAEALPETLREAGRQPGIIQQGDHLSLEGGAGIDVLWPPGDCDMNSNNCGLVLMLQYAGRTVLFPADIQAPPELELLKSPAQLKCDVLVAPHHGSAEISTVDFLRAANPALILASNDRRLTHKQKTFDAVAADYRVYRTHRYGALTIQIDADAKLSVHTYLGDPAPAAEEVGANAASHGP